MTSTNFPFERATIYFQPFIIINYIELLLKIYIHTCRPSRISQVTNLRHDKYLMKYRLRVQVSWDLIVVCDYWIWTYTGAYNLIQFTTHFIIFRFTHTQVQIGSSSI